MELIEKHLDRERAIYKDAPIAPERLGQFFLCWQDDTTQERGWVIGEDGSGWLEVYEMGMWNNFDDVEDSEYDGLTYYVGDYNFVPVRPSIEEIADAVMENDRRDYDMFGWPLKFAQELLSDAQKD